MMSMKNTTTMPLYWNERVAAPTSTTATTNNENIIYNNNNNKIHISLPQHVQSASTTMNQQQQQQQQQQPTIQKQLQLLRSANRYRQVVGNATTTTNSNQQRQKRVQFTLFIKILFKQLKETGDEYLIDTAKRIVSLGINKRSQQQQPLRLETIEIPLREYVGEDHWRRAHKYMKFYLNKQRTQNCAQQLQQQQTPRTSMYRRTMF